MRRKKRLSVTVDIVTYERLESLRHKHGFNSLCELVGAMVHVLMDRMEDAEQRKYDLPEDEGRYIDTMFDELSNIQHTLPADNQENRLTKSIK